MSAKPSTKFERGNSAAKGRSTRGEKLAAAFRSAVTEKEMHALARRLYELAMQKGNVPAVVALLDRIVGRPRVATMRIEIDIGDTSSLEGCESAMGRILTATASGALDLDAAEQLTRMIELRVRAREGADLDDHLDLLEEQQAQERKANSHGWS